jgi:phage host-nuclease inhibitor protein Gam
MFECVDMCWRLLLMRYCCGITMATKKPGPSKKEKKLQEGFDISKKEIEKLKEEIKSLNKEVASLNKALNDEDVETIKDQCLKFRLTVGDLHPSVLDWFNKSNSKNTKDYKIRRLHEAVRIGLLAQMQGRIGHAMNSYREHLSEEMSILKNYTNIFEQKFLTDNKFKTDQEETVKLVLAEYIQSQNYADSVRVTGTTADGDGNKTGDILATIMHAESTHNLAIEVKFATDYPQGGVASKANKATSYRAQTDTSISQIIESRKNRKSRYAMIVLDKSLNIHSDTPEIHFIPEAQGVIVKVDLLANEYSNLEIAYDLLRQMTVSSIPIDLDFAVLEYLLTDLSTVLGRQKRITEVSKDIIKQLEESHKKNLDKVITISAMFEAELKAMQVAISQTTRMMKQWLKTGNLSADDAFETYMKSKAQAEWTVEKMKHTEMLDLHQKMIREKIKHEEESQTVSKPEKKKTEGKATKVDYGSMTVPELKVLLKAAGKPVSGTKAKLIARLNE